MNLMSDALFNNLRQKLDILGYTQTLPLAGIPLVSALFEDLVKTTESLRDAKKQIVTFLEEKSCWELGVEPYKCDNARLLAECNQLHLNAIRQQDDFQQRMFELNQRIRHLQSDKQHFEQHCQELERQLNCLMTKQSNSKTAHLSVNRKVATKKPFVSTVRSGGLLPESAPTSSTHNALRCSKCQVGCCQRTDSEPTSASKAKLEVLERKLDELNSQLDFFKRKVETRDREIQRLSEQLNGGRPVTTLAKSCCYKDLQTLKEDIEMMSREKMNHLNKMRECQDKMHEAMKRALDLEQKYQQTRQELEEFKNAALQMEKDANATIEERENLVEKLQSEMKLLREQYELNSNTQKVSGSPQSTKSSYDKCKMKERLNELLRTELDLKETNKRLHAKVHQLKTKVVSLKKELNDVNTLCKQDRLDEEKIRLKSERDFFQKEYLRAINKTGSEKEIEFLQSQINCKDEELKMLRNELCQLRYPKSSCHAMGDAGASTTAMTLSTDRSTARSDSNACVQAVLLRVERERDCARAELERVLKERDMLRDKHLVMSQVQCEETRKTHERVHELLDRIKELEHVNRDLQSARGPGDTHIVLLKEEVSELKKELFAQQNENVKINGAYNKLRLLHEQTERSLVDLQNKLTLAENQLQNAGMRLQTLDTTKETARNESEKLRNELVALKQTYIAIEHEKDQLVNDLDERTERIQQLECELKTFTDKCTLMESQIKELKDDLQRQRTLTREFDTEIKENSAETHALRQQIHALKVSRDQATADHTRLLNTLSDSQAECLTLRKKLKESETEVERLKQQLRQYVQEVKKAEDLLMCKEKERDEMLDHYRSLSHDAVLLEGNNQSLEVEAAEHKRQISELEAQIEELKKELCCKNNTIAELEEQITLLKSKNCALEHDIQEASDDMRLLKVDMTARKELCEKLDIQCDKLNAELQEINEIRQKLERENERLRNEANKAGGASKMPEETLTELLNKTRRDLEEQLKTDTKLTQELMRVRQQNEKLMHDLDDERQKREHQETLAREYQVQNQELRHNLTDDRFRQARSREQSPRYPAQTL